MPGQVGKIRELDRGIQADVCIGWSKDGEAVIKVTGNSAAVKRAMTNLRKALVAEAGDLLLGAQAYETSRGRAAIGSAP